MRYPAIILAAGLCLAATADRALAVESRRPAKPAAKSGTKNYDEAKLKALEAQLAKKPKDAKLKLEVAEANYQVGYAMMTNPKLMPRVKYPGALRKFGRALQLNPKHQKAARDKKMIEDIYRSMGRPIPS